MPNLDSAADSAATWITGAVLVSVLTILVVWGALSAKFSGRGPGSLIETIVYRGVAIGAPAIVAAMVIWFRR